MANLTLTAAPRTVLGKRVKQLRRAGIVPGVVYGHGLDSQAVQLPAKELVSVASQAGQSALVQLQIEGESQARNVVLRRLTHEAVSGRPRHVDFYQVRMDEAIAAEVPLHFTGKAPAVGAEGGIVLTLHTNLRVKALPNNMPPAIAVDLGGLEHVDDAIMVRDLHLPEGVEVQAGPEDIIVKVNAPRIAAEEIPVEATAQPTEAAAAEGGEGAAAAE